MYKKVFIIAEAGVNHNGSLAIAKKLIDAAVKAGADAVKFQTFNAEALVSRSAPKATYQKKSTAKKANQLEMLKKLELDLDAHKVLLNYCNRKKIIFMSSAFGIDDINMLSKLGLKIFKIPSGEITNLPYLRVIASLRKKLILSTGMANLKEIETALKVLIKNGVKKRDVAVLHCNTEYPTPFRDVNLSAMLTIRDKLKVPIGYSDHTPGIEVPIAAAALGAMVIEKHFTLDKKMEGPDHQASLEPKQLKQMVLAIRNIEKVLGDGTKKPSNSEMKNIPIVRKSIVAAKDIKRGDKFNETNITVKRPGYGLSPMLWDALIGKKAKQDYKTDDLIKI